MRQFHYFLIISLLSFNKVSSQDLFLKGELTGFENDTKIIINPYLNNMDISMDDETIILLKEGRFEFSRQLDRPTKFSLRVRPQNQDNIVAFEQLTFWAENAPMTLTGTKGQVFQSKISGSVIQDQYFEYILGVAKLENEAKQILDSVKTYPNLSEDIKSDMRVRFHTANKVKEEKRMEFIYNNPNYYCAAPELVYYLTFSPDRIERKKLNEFYNKMNPVIQLNDYRTQLETFLFKDKENVKSQPLEVGDYPFNFALKDSDGKDIKFSSITSKVILLDFWASGCGPCRLEHKNYLALYKEFKDKGFEIVSVSQDQSKKRWLDAMKKDGMSWISLWDENKKVSNGLYNVSSLPTNYLIIDGKIVAKTLAGEQLRKKIEGVFNKTKN